MRIALVDSIGKSTHYPIGLLRISSWRKSLGDQCILFTNALPKPGEFDEIWVSVTFTFDIPQAVALLKEATKRATGVVVGGIAVTLFPDAFKETGATVRPGRVEAAEGFSPDASILHEKPQYSLTRTSLGCIRKCSFCGVSKLEPIFKNREWIGDLWPDTHIIRFYDNNWLAKEKRDLEKDIAILRDLVGSKTINEIDFNQGIDCRLITPEIANMIQGLPIKPFRLAFDGPQEDGPFQKAVELLAKHGFHNFQNYTLYNFHDTPQNTWYRIREQVRLHVELKVGVYPFLMRYHPLEDFGRNYVGKYWTAQMLHGFQSCMTAHAANTALSPHSLEEFGYWFGDTEEEFVKLLSYPKIRQLNERKKSSLRWKRADGIKSKQDLYGGVQGSLT